MLKFNYLVQPPQLVELLPFSDAETDEVIECCNIGYIPPAEEFLRYNCFFSGDPVTGYVSFSSQQFSLGTTVDVNIDIPTLTSKSGNMTYEFHEFSASKKNKFNCGTIGNSWSPCRNGICVSGTQDIPDQFRILTNSTTAYNFLAPSITMTGYNSILGRSLAIHNAAGKAIDCCQIVLSQGALLPYTPTLEYTGRTAECVFDEVYPVHGLIQFAELNSPSAEVTLGSYVQILGAGDGLNTETGNPYHIHVSNISAGCNATGPHYNPNNGLNYTSNGTLFGLSELANKHGNMIGPNFADSFLDSSLLLHGPYSILGRSVTVHAPDGTRIACCDILPTDIPLAIPPTGLAPSVSAACFFGKLKSSFNFSQPSPTGIGSRVGMSKTLYTSLGEGEYKYYILTNGHTPDTCPNNPLFTTNDGVGPDDSGHPFSTDSPSIRIGDLSGKYRPLIEATKFVYHDIDDGQIWLTGPFGIIGRSIVAVQGERVADCCVIGFTDPDGVGVAVTKTKTPAGVVAAFAVVVFLVALLLVVALVLWFYIKDLRARIEDHQEASGSGYALNQHAT